MNLPGKMVRNIQASFANPKYFVKHKSGHQRRNKKHKGIRQGCPLSPYLFVLVMHVMFEDIKING